MRASVACSLLLEIIFLLYYSGRANGFDSVMQIARILHSQNFGKRQVLYTYLSDRGRRTVEVCCFSASSCRCAVAQHSILYAVSQWIGHMCILIVLNLMNFEHLLSVWDNAHTPHWRFDALPVYASHPLMNAPAEALALDEKVVCMAHQGNGERIRGLATFAAH
jgi:hypothetical protein